MKHFETETSSSLLASPEFHSSPKDEEGDDDDVELASIPGFSESMDAKDFLLARLFPKKHAEVSIFPVYVLYLITILWRSYV